MEYNSIYRAIVTCNYDPEKRGRIKVTCPYILGEYESNWCTPCYPLAEYSGGFFYVPDVNSTAWIMFEEGNPDKPIWLGGWVIPTLPPPSDSEIQEQLENQNKYIVKEDLLPTILSDNKGKLSDTLALTKKNIGGLIFQKTFDNKYTFQINALDTAIKGTVSSDGSLVLNYKSDTIIELKEDSVVLKTGNENVTLSKENGISFNSSSNINIHAEGNVNLTGSKINLN